MGDFGDWEGDEEAAAANGDTTTHADAEQADRHVTPRASVAPMNTSEAANLDLGDLGQHMTNMSLNGTDSTTTNGTTHQPPPETPDRQITPPSSSVTQPVSINVSGANEYTGLCPVYPTASDGLVPDRVHEGPMTPRNDIGPFVLDGSAGRNGASFLHNTELPSSSSESDTNGRARSSSGAPSLPPVRFD